MSATRQSTRRSRLKMLPLRIDRGTHTLGEASEKTCNARIHC